MQFLFAIAILTFIYTMGAVNDVLMRMFFWCAPRMGPKASGLEALRTDHIFQAGVRADCIYCLRILQQLLIVSSSVDDLCTFLYAELSLSETCGVSW